MTLFNLFLIIKTLWNLVSRFFIKTDKRKHQVLKQLLEHIRCRRDDEVKSMLDNDLVSNDDFGTLLHHAAKWDNEVVVRHLIDLGTDVNWLDRQGRTPLMLAIRECHLAIVEILLEAEANIHIVSATHPSALQMVFYSEYQNTGIIKLLLSRLQTETDDTKQLVDKLVAMGCTLHKAIYLRDSQVIQCMLERAFNVNSRDYRAATAIHVAASINEAPLVKLLIDRGANVNALDRDGLMPLTYAAWNGNSQIMKLLLEAGADPNDENALIQYNITPRVTTLLILFDKFGNVSTEETDECVELLFQHGVIPRYSNHMFHIALSGKRSSKLNMLVNYLVMIKELGQPADDLLLKPCSIISELTDYCEKFLRSVVFENLTMLELLTDSEAKMRTYVRNRNLMTELQHYLSDDKNKNLLPYYCSILTKRVYKARRDVKLEDAAISVISELMKCNVNLCYEAARKVVGYLQGKDLEQLGHV